jgi:2-alkyl-3-oxoalkanoate reductase
VFGAGDNRFVPAIVSKARQGKLTRAIGNRDKLSDFTYIDNLVDAVVAAEERLVPGSPVCGQAYFVTNGEPLAFFDFVDRMLAALGHAPIRKRVPYGLAYAAAAVAEALDALRGGAPGEEGRLSRFAVRYMVTHHYFSIARARRDLQWSPAVSLDEGIRRTVAALAG